MINVVLTVTVIAFQFGTYVIHIFPPCEFSDVHLNTCASDFLAKVRARHTSYLFVVITMLQQPNA